MKECGEGDWKAVAAHMGDGVDEGRCRRRWSKHINPMPVPMPEPVPVLYEQGPWSAEEVSINITNSKKSSFAER